ncbi:single hybrid motif-containing protein [Globomyces pollinis-pini]|nr:single hybrid motif-containing protein [Globomyces pollinis-pini]
MVSNGQLITPSFFSQLFQMLIQTLKRASLNINQTRIWPSNNASYLIKRFMSQEKTVKTPSMGESITEGTLTEWLKKVGDYVQRDEQIATVETDKIDVQVNSPENGTVIALFANEGDTIAVGNNLFTIAVGEGEATQSTKPKSEPTPIESKPVESVSKSVSAPKASAQHRQPLIKFLGPRKLLWGSKPVSESLSKSTPPQPIAFNQPTVTVTQGGVRVIEYESILQLPKRFQPLPFTDAELETINAGGL